MATITNEPRSDGENSEKVDLRHQFLLVSRSLASSMCFTLCVLFLAFRFRSYFTLVGIQGRLSEGSHFVTNFQEGLVTFSLLGFLVPVTHEAYQEVVDRDVSWSCHTITISDIVDLVGEGSVKPDFGFRASIRKGYWNLTAPCWFMVLLTCFIGFLVKPSPRTTFENRDLFLVLFLFATMLGLFEALAVDVMSVPIKAYDVSVQLINGGDYVCDNPSKDTLREILELQQDALGSFFILKISEENYLQGTLTAEGFWVEYRNGSSEQHFSSESPLTLEEALELTVAYANLNDEWKDLTSWKRLHLSYQKQ